MSILCLENQNTIPQEFTISGNNDNHPNLMGKYIKIDKTINNEFIYKNKNNNFYFYYSGNDTRYWLFTYSKQDLNNSLGGIRVLKKLFDNKNILECDQYTYENTWIKDNNIKIDIHW